MIDKIKKFLSNPAMTIFLFIMEGACLLALFTRAIQNKDAAQITVLILLLLASIGLIIRFGVKEKK